MRDVRPHTSIQTSIQTYLHNACPGPPSPLVPWWSRHRLRKVKGWRNRKELSRQIRFRLLQMQQMTRRQHRTADLLCKATRAGGKLQLAPPRTARGLRPSVQPPMGHRYRAMEPGAGWVVRPHIEPHGELSGLCC